MSLDQSMLSHVPGGGDLLSWFEGSVPSFHDAEILSLSLERENARCAIAIHAFQMTNAVDANGYFVTRKHAVIRFELERVSGLELSDFNHQNVIDGITLTLKPDGEYSLELEPCYGLSGTVTAADLKIALMPGIPSGSIYMNQNPARPS